MTCPFLFQFKVSVSTLYIIIPSQSHSLCYHQMTSKQSATHVVSVLKCSVSYLSGPTHKEEWNNYHDAAECHPENHI